MIAIGEACPDFALPNDRGETVTLGDFENRPLVLFFYPKDDTSGCTQEALEFSALQGAFDEAGIALLGVSPDPVKRHAKFRDKHSLSVRLLSDEERTLIEACGVWIEKSMYGRSYMGVDRSTVLVGADGRIAQVWPKVKVPGHAEEVLKAAKAATGAG